MLGGEPVWLVGTKLGKQF